MAEFIEVRGGATLSGEVCVGGAKNAVLPMLIVSLLTSEECVFDNVPNLSDVSLTVHLLKHFGAEVEYRGEKIVARTPRLVATEASYSLVKAFRASFWVLGPLLARGGAARVALPGGDIIGARPVDMHLEALKQMGAEITVKHGVVLATAPEGLSPAAIEFRFPSVGATHQVLLAASLTPGTTTIKGAACEPEVVALANLLQSMGAKIEGAGTPDITIEGAETLSGTKVHLIGDRIEAATYLLGTMATKGEVRVRGFDPAHLGALVPVLEEMGAELTMHADGVSLKAPERINPVKVTTAPFPGFATDMQAPLMAALCFADGESVIEETIFEGRYGHVSELSRMGAEVIVDGRIARIHGKPSLSGAPVEAYDIRAAAALVIAGLAAEGDTQIFEPQHLRRGYAGIEQKMAGIGGMLGVRLKDPEDYMFTGC